MLMRSAYALHVLPTFLPRIVMIRDPFYEIERRSPNAEAVKLLIGGEFLTNLPMQPPRAPSTGELPCEQAWQAPGFSMLFLKRELVLLQVRYGNPVVVVIFCLTNTRANGS